MKKLGIGAVIVVAIAGFLVYRNRERILTWALRPLGEALFSPGVERTEQHGKVTVEHWRHFVGSAACGRSEHWVKLIDPTGRVLVERARAMTVSPDGRWIVVAPGDRAQSELVLIDTRNGAIRGRAILRSVPKSPEAAQWLPGSNLAVLDTGDRIDCSEDGIRIPSKD